MCSGPYEFVRWRPGADMTIERNDSYWGAKPKLKRIVFDIVKDPSARVAAIQSGQVDITINVPVRDVERRAGRNAKYECSNDEL